MSGGVADFSQKARSKRYQVKSHYRCSNTYAYIVLSGAERIESVTEEEFRAVLAETEAAFHFGAWFRTAGTPQVVWSSGMYQLFGIHPTVQASHALYLGAIHPEDRRVHSVIAKAGPDGFSRRQFRIASPDGVHRHVSSVTAELTSQGDRPHHQVGVVFDSDEGRYGAVVAEDLLARLKDRSAPNLPVKPLAERSDNGDELPASELLDAALIRAARAMLDWTLGDTSKASQLSFSTVRRAEGGSDRHLSQPSSVALRQTFEAHGIRFIRLGDSVGLVRKSSPIDNDGV